MKVIFAIAALALFASTSSAQCRNGQCQTHSVLMPIPAYTPPAVATEHYQESHAYSYHGSSGGHGRGLFRGTGPVRRFAKAKPLRRAAGAVLAWRPFRGRRCG